MARQPFLPTYKNVPVSIGSRLIEQIPRLAELVGRIAINWSGVDVQLAVALGSLLGVENASAVAVFVSLRNHRAQRDAIRAAADQTLAGEIREIFDAIMAWHEELDGQRNSFIHCIWGRCENTPDGIVWSSVQAHANMLISDYHMESTGQLTHDRRNENMTKDLFVVRLNDLEELNSSIIALEHAIGAFHAHLRYKGLSAGDHALVELQKNPAIQLIRARKSSTVTIKGVPPI